MAGRSSPHSKPDHNHHRRQVVARDCHPRTTATRERSKKESSALTHAMLCYVAVAVVVLLLIARQAQVNFGGVQTAAWQILRHQPGGGIAFGPLLP